MPARRRTPTAANRSRTSARLVVTLMTDQEGLSMVLGPLEAAVLTALWGAPGPWSVGEVRCGVQEQGVDVAQSTVQSTLNRLADKRLVLKISRGGRASRYTGYTYAPAVNRAAYTRAVVQVVHDALDRFIAAMEVTYEAA